MNRFIISLFMLTASMYNLYALSLRNGVIKLLEIPDRQIISEHKDRYKNVDFSVVNAEGQLLHYTILPEGNNTVALVSMDGKKNRYNDSHYTIPATVNYNGINYTVTELGKEAFCKSKVKSVQLPSTIKKIANLCFFASELKGIKLNEGLEIIGNGAFDYCTSFTSAVLIPNSVKLIGSSAFYGTNIRELSVPNNIQNIGENAFCVHASMISVSRFSGMIHNLPNWINSSNCIKYGIDKEAFNAYYNAKLAKQNQSTNTPQIIYVQENASRTTSSGELSPNVQNTATIETHTTPSSDVDKNIPTNPTNNTNTFAIIIANENYQEESKVDYALNDGELFKTYCNKVLGLPEKNIHFRKDATLNNILFEVEWLSKVAQAYNGEANLIVYYAGHGIPDETSNSAYLLPIDGKGTMLATGYSLANLYKTLGALPAKSVTVFMDACFSGAQRSGKMLASARGIAIKAKPETPKGKMIVFSAAQGDETAYPYADKQHGLFTYYLLKKLQETKGDVTYSDLGEYITQQVSRKSIVENGKSQTPTVVPSVNWGESWKAMKLR